MIPEFISNPDPEIFFSENFLVLDLETTNIDKGSALNADNKLLLSCWYPSSTGGEHVCDGNEYEQGYLLEAVENVDFIIAHNAKFELQWLQRMGVDISQLVVFDTMIAEYVLNGNIKVPLGLGQVTARYGYGDKEPYIDLCIKDGICPSELPRKLLADRVVKDVQQTYRIFKDQLRELEASNKLAVFYTKCLLTPVLADIEKNGMYLDKERVEDAYIYAYAKLVSINKQLGELTGGINPRSTKQLREFIYKTLGFSELKDKKGSPIRTKKGSPKTDEATIGGLRATTPEQREFLRLKKDHSHYNALISKSLDFFNRVCREKGGIFRAHFNQTIARTGRLTSSAVRITFLDGETKGVQLQNQPRALKPLFRARNNEWKVREDDAAQLEFRVAGYLGRDGAIVHDANERNDIHQFTADTLSREGTNTTRQDAKSRTFKPLYGGRSGTRAERKYYEAFRNKYKGITAAQEEWITAVLKDKMLTLATGQEFFWPDTSITSTGYIVNRESICNYPVQYLATGEIIPISLVKLWHEVKDKGLSSFINNTVHDSIITELYPPEEKVYDALVKEAMTDYVYYYLEKVYGIKWFVPLDIGTKTGTHWTEGEEVEYKSNPPYTLEETA